jgi:hypothetical protein
MNPAVVLLANRSLPFSLYDFHLNGVSARELAHAYSLPLPWVEERLEAVRLCLKYQVTFRKADAQSGGPDDGAAAVHPVRSGRAASRCRTVRRANVVRFSDLRQAA